MYKVIRYASIEEAGQDTAFGLLEDKDYHNKIKVQALGPGYNPEDCSNKADAVWGQYIPTCTPEKYDKIVSGDIDIGPGYHIEGLVIPDWNDHEHIKQVMEDLMNGVDYSVVTIRPYTTTSWLCPTCRARNIGDPVDSEKVTCRNCEDDFKAGTWIQF